MKRWRWCAAAPLGRRDGSTPVHGGCVNALTIACAFALLVGCDGFGRALVDERGQEHEPPVCQREEACEAVVPVPPSRDDEEPSGADGCEDAPVPPACDGGPAAEPAMNGGSLEQCGRLLSLDDGRVDPSALATLACERLVLERKVRGAAATLRLTDVTWTQLDVAIRTRDPFVLELERATLDDVRLRLVGPVSVRVVRPLGLSQVQVQGEHSAAGLSILDGRIATLRAGNTLSAFAGSLTIERAFVRGARLRATRLQIESSELLDVALETEQLQLADCTGRRLALSFDVAQLTASSLSELAVERCGRLAMYDASLSHARLPACAMPPTRVYNSSLEGSSIEGEIVADYAQLSGVRVGASDATDLQLWETNLASVRFCAGTNSVRLGVKNVAACISCTEDDGTPVPFTACRTSDDTLELSRGCGPLFAPPRCDPELERMRPSAKL